MPALRATERSMIRIKGLPAGLIVVHKRRSPLSQTKVRYFA